MSSLKEAFVKRTCPFIYKEAVVQYIQGNARVAKHYEYIHYIPILF